MRATVKWFNEGKGYGFLTCEDGREAFVHIKAVDDDVDMVEGLVVEAEIEPGPKGLRAKSVTVALSP